MILALCLWQAGAAASGLPSIELFGGVSLFLPALESTWDASYTPSRVGGIQELFLEPDPRSRATQLLRLSGERAWAFGLGANVYPHRVVGFQFLFDKAEVDISGDNPAHEVDLTYDTIAFPSSDRVVRQLSFSFDSPPTEGRLDELLLSFNAVARFGGGGPVGGSLSGGLSYFQLEGEAQSLGAFAASLGGHAVLFTEIYQTAYVIEAADRIGFNLGGTLDVAFGAHAGLFVDGRWFHAPETEARVSLESLVSANLTPVTAARIDEFLDLPPLAIDPSAFRILFGLKVKP